MWVLGFFRSGWQGCGTRNWLFCRWESKLPRKSFENVDSSPLHGCLQRGNFASQNYNYEH